MAESPRQQKLARQIHRQLAPLLQTRVRDGQCAYCTMTRVSVSSDLSHARIWVHGGPLQNQLADDSVSKALIKQLIPLLPAMRQHLSRQLRMRRVPELAVYYDDVMERRQRMDSLINQAISNQEDT